MVFMDLLLLIFLMLDIRYLCAFYCLFIMTVSRIVRNIVNDGSNDIAELVFFVVVVKFFFSLETRSNKFNSIVNASDCFKKRPMNSYRKFANWQIVIFANINLTNGFYCHIFFWKFFYTQFTLFFWWVLYHEFKLYYDHCLSPIIHAVTANFHHKTIAPVVKKNWSR